MTNKDSISNYVMFTICIVILIFPPFPSHFYCFDVHIWLWCLLEIPLCVWYSHTQPQYLHTPGYAPDHTLSWNWEFQIGEDGGKRLGLNKSPQGASLHA